MIFTTLIEAAELQGLMGKDSLRLVDCRFSLADPAAGEAAFREGHLPGAGYAHLEKHLSGRVIAGRTGRHPLPDADELRRFAGSLGITPESQVIAYDEGGPFAARFWWLLRWLGHEAVAVLNGGLPAWQEAGGELGTQPAKTAAAPSYPVLKPGVPAVTTDELLQGENGQLLDAREGPRFRGEVEPIDPVAGHIPGALNQPFTEHFRAPGFYKTKAQIRAGSNHLPHDEGLICYCGSGVTATVNILAMVHAGLPAPRLYAGSFSEWIADPKRAVATG